MAPFREGIVRARAGAAGVGARSAHPYEVYASAPEELRAVHVLYAEPYDGGSHASFTHALTSGLDARFTRLTLPGRHWKWRMRGFAAWAALARPDALTADVDLVFASSYVPLAELVGLAPWLARVPRLYYFHENQLSYPVLEARERDGHFGFTQLVSALAATACIFNSAHNRDAFLTSAAEVLARMPDAVPPGWVETIAARSEVLAVPVALPDAPPDPEVEPLGSDDRRRGPIVLWNHRWEHDKNPEGFFGALFRLADAGAPFRLAVCGQRFAREPEIFERARQRLDARIVHWGPCDDTAAYHALLQRAHLCVSTAHHEFFGVSMIEATHFGAHPVVPDRLSYPEIFDAKYRYRDDDALVVSLGTLCRAFVHGAPLRADRRSITEPFSTRALLPRYDARLRRAVAEGP
jgi:glycosyltransferase involved in cell wall biosynthesis